MARTLVAALAVLATPEIAVAQGPPDAVVSDAVGPPVARAVSPPHPEQVVATPLEHQLARPAPVQPVAQHFFMVGGKPVSHPWVVELYSVNRFTDAEIAADAALGAASNAHLFLADQADWELYHRCGGVLVAHDWVLTAGHCVDGVLGEGGVVKQRRVRAATADLEHGGTTFAIDRFVLHQNYQADPLLFDVALLHLVADAQTDAVLASYPKKVAPLDRPERNRPLAPDDTLRAMGWGGIGHRQPTLVPALSSDGQRQHMSPLLLQVKFRVASLADCAAIVAYAVPVSTGGVICAMPVVEATGDCNGDSGGPVVRADFRLFQSPNYRLVGLVSQGRGCAAGQPSLFTRVSDYANWIAETIAAPPAGPP